MTARDAKSLYQSLIVDHAKSPHHEGALESATHRATSTNPLCGDRVTVHLEIRDGVVHAATFEARGCMIARASASILTDAIAGSTVAAALERAKWLELFLSEKEADSPTAGTDELLDPLRGARAFPARIACVLLAWRALEKAVVD